MNSAYNVGLPQRRRIQEETIRAACIMEEGEENWKLLFENSDFFVRHSNFLQLTIRASNANDFFKWQRFCESRLRLLITSLETPQVNVWPFAKFFKRTYSPIGIRNKVDNVSKDGLHESYFFIALRFAVGVETVSLRYSMSDFLHKVNSWEERKEGMDLGIAHILKDDLPPEVFETSTETISVNPRPRTPVDQEETGTRLTPKLARSTLSVDDIDTQSKRARPNSIGDSDE